MLWHVTTRILPPSLTLLIIVAANIIAGLETKTNYKGESRNYICGPEAIKTMVFITSEGRIFRNTANTMQCLGLWNP